MSTFEKLKQKARDNPAGLRYSDLKKLYEGHGWRLAGGKGSHRVFRREGMDKLKSVPQKNPVNRQYVKEMFRNFEKYASSE